MVKTEKFVTILLWALIIISAVLVVSLLVNISENETDATMGNWINSNLIWSYILVIFAAGVAIIFAIFHMLSDKKALKNGLVTLVFFAVVLGISYILASDAIPQFVGVEKFLNDGTLNAKVSKLIDTGLNTTYILLGLAVLSIAFSSVSRLFGK